MDLWMDLSPLSRTTYSKNNFMKIIKNITSQTDLPLPPGLMFN